MISLKDYWEENVEIIAADGQVFIGYAGDYFYPEDNENNIESLAIETKDHKLIEFYPKDIKSIAIIE